MNKEAFRTISNNIQNRKLVFPKKYIAIVISESTNKHIMREVDRASTHKLII